MLKKLLGECNSSYTIFNFKNNKKNVLFSAASRSVLDCGRVNEFEDAKIGDTLETNSACSLFDDKNNSKSVQQIRTIKIYNGGSTNEERMKNLLIKTDTTIIELK